MPPKKVEKAPPEDFLVSFVSHPDPFVQFVFTILAILVIVYIANGLLAILAAARIAPFMWLSDFYDFLTGNSLQIWIVRLFGVLVSVLSIYFIIRLIQKITVLRKAEHALLYPDIPTAVDAVNPRWKRIIDHVESINENDWRQAIIESDIMLSELLDNMGLPGDTIGDKLKAVATGDFATLDKAWEAHKIRNRIAHDGSAFMLTQRQAREVISQYESVFKEFKII